MRLMRLSDMSSVKEPVPSICSHTACELSIRNPKRNDVDAAMRRQRFVHGAVSVQTLRLHNASNDDNPNARASASNGPYRSTVDPYTDDYGRTFGVVTYVRLTMGGFTSSNRNTDSKFPI